MSIKTQLIERAYTLNLTQRAMLVALYLINRSNKDGACFPGIKTIAKECKISQRTTQRAVKDLEKAQFVKREERYHEQGGQRSNMYYLQMTGDSTIEIDTGLKQEQERVTEVKEEQVLMQEREPVSATEIEPKQETEAKEEQVLIQEREPVSVTEIELKQEPGIATERTRKSKPKQQEQRLNKGKNILKKMITFSKNFRRHKKVIGKLVHVFNNLSPTPCQFDAP